MPEPGVSRKSCLKYADTRAHTVLTSDYFLWSLSKGNNVRLDHKILPIYDHFSPPQMGISCGSTSYKVPSVSGSSVENVSKKRRLTWPKACGDGADQERRGVWGKEKMSAAWACEQTRPVSSGNRQHRGLTRTKEGRTRSGDSTPSQAPHDSVTPDNFFSFHFLRSGITRWMREWLVKFDFQTENKYIFLF